MIDELLGLLNSKKLKIEIIETSSKAAIIAFDVWAKPGAKVEKIFVSPDGMLIVQTRSKPIEGEANQSIVAAVAEVMGISKSSVEIIRGEKSRQKRIKVLLELTANKNEIFYKQKFNAI